MGFLLKVKRFLSRKVRVAGLIYHLAPWIEVLGGAFLLYHTPSTDAQYILGLLAVYAGIRASLLRAFRGMTQ